MKMGLWTRVINLALPQECFVCGGRLSPTENGMCSVCSLHLPRTGFCSPPHDNPMTRLFGGLVAVDKVAALFYYEAHSDVPSVIYVMKYYWRPDIGLKLGRMARYKAEHDDVRLHQMMFEMMQYNILRSCCKM